MRKELITILAIIITISIENYKANASLAITPTWDSSLTSLSNASLYEATINQTIASVQSYIPNNVTVKILFANTASGLGQNFTYYSGISYFQYRNDLLSKQILSANDNLAISTLPSSGTPVAGENIVQLTTPILRALGEISGTYYNAYDSTISINLSICNPNRTGTQTSGYFDLQTVLTHEISEVLGTGGAGSQLGNNTNNQLGPLDLFRFSAANTRSFTTNSLASSYFSIDNGSNSIASFNQSSSADYADWAQSGYAQSAFGTPNVTNINLTSKELTALDVVGWNIVSVPEPAPILLFSVAALILIVYRRSKLTNLIKNS